MDKAQEYEIHVLCENLPWANKQEMERLRMLMYSVTAPYMKKGQKKSLQEFLPLYTDDLEREERRLDDEEVNNIRKAILSFTKNTD